MVSTIGAISTSRWMQDISGARTITKRGQAASTASSTTTFADVIGWEEAVTGKQGNFIVPKDAADLQKMQEWFQDYLERNPVPEYTPLPDLSEVMTDEMWATLAEKYDPTNMTQEQYDAFLEELCAMGALNPEDLPDLGHSQDGLVLTKVTAESLRGYLANSVDLPSITPVPKFENGAERVNLWHWAQEEKAWKYYDSDIGDWMQSHKAQAFQQIYDILQGMQSCKTN